MIAPGIHFSFPPLTFLTLTGWYMSYWQTLGWNPSCWNFKAICFFFVDTVSRTKVEFWTAFWERFCECYPSYRVWCVPLIQEYFWYPVLSWQRIVWFLEHSLESLYVLFYYEASLPLMDSVFLDCTVAVHIWWRLTRVFSVCFTGQLIWQTFHPGLFKC